MLTVHKYGGTSLADPQCLLRAARRTAALARQGHGVVLVVSAQGDTTDTLIRAAGAVCPQPAARELDALLAAGEQMSAALMAMAIGSLGQRAVSLTGWQAGLRTDDRHGDARILGLEGDRLNTLLGQGVIPVVAGFQGLSRQGEITTLGRGGSDTTAVALAAFLKADSCRIFTDVEGVYDRDPRHCPEAVRYDALPAAQMLEMARQGAQVLHSRCVELAMAHQVTVQVCSAFTDGPGTLVIP